MLTRRSFVGLVAGLSASVIPAYALNNDGKVKGKGKHLEEEISAVEDLMREHGALNRILLIYEKAADSISRNDENSRELIRDTARLVNSFIGDYHENLEEEFVFPRFRKAGVLVSLVDTLEKQHKAGKKLTANILGLTNSETSFKANKPDLIRNLTQFIRIYRPHEAREDTVLFPAFKSVVGDKEYMELGEQFEEKEHKLFGDDGFSGIIAQIADIEKKLGIYDLNQFTDGV